MNGRLFKPGDQVINIKPVKYTHPENINSYVEIPINSILIITGIDDKNTFFELAGQYGYYFYYKTKNDIIIEGRIIFEDNIKLYNPNINNYLKQIKFNYEE